MKLEEHDALIEAINHVRVEARLRSLRLRNTGHVSAAVLLSDEADRLQLMLVDLAGARALAAERGKGWVQGGRGDVGGTRP